MIDILFVAHNRLAYTRQAFAALLTNTDWSQVGRLCIADDASSDGTAEYLANAPLAAAAERVWSEGPLGGPVAAMNWFLSLPRDHEGFAKIDNDILVPPGWLEQALPTFDANLDVDVLGLGYREEPRPKMRAGGRGIERARHIGGVGLMRRRIFDVCRPVANGRFGWTEWQCAHADIGKGWLSPPLPIVELDRLPASVGPWRGLAEEYAERGWQRLWDPYPPEAERYWSWWQPA